jgi:hypothetical protein
MTLQELISKIEDNLIDTITQVDGIDESFFPNIEDIRNNVRRLLETAATEVVQDGIQRNENVNVSRFVRNFQVRATTIIRTQLLRQTNQRLSITYEQISESVNDAIQSSAGDGNLLNMINDMRRELSSEGVIQPSDIDTSETTPSTVGEARRATQTFDEVLDDFIRPATGLGDEKRVDLLEAFKNDSGVKELVGDNSLRIEDLKNFLIEIDVYKSQLYGEDMKIRAGISKTFDDEFVKVLQKYAKDKGMVLELFIERGFDTVHNEGSIIDRNSVSPNYKANQSNRNFTKKIYFPEETDDVAKRVQEYIDVQKRIFTERENVSFAEITPGGPEFTTNRPNHKKYGDFMTTIFGENKSELNAFFDTQDVKVIMIGGSQKASNAETGISPLYKGGIKKYFEKLATKAKGEKLKPFIDKPSYTLGTVWNNNIINLVASDSRRASAVSNSVTYVPDQNYLSMDTNFYSTNPQTVRGYYPNLTDGGDVFKSWKSQLYLASEEWFQGILHLADLDSVNIEVSAMNGQVGNLYQFGGFIPVTKPEDTRITSMGTMIRVPNRNRELKDGWKVARQKKVEWRSASLSGRAQSSAWGSPYSESYTWERKQFKDIESSPRHQALLGILQADYNDTFRISQIGDMTRHILNLGGLNNLSTADIKMAMEEIIDSGDLDGLKYVVGADNISNTRNNLFTDVNDIKLLAKLMLRTTSLRDITGVTMLPGDVQGNITTDINTSSFLTGQPDSKEVLNVFNEVLDNQDIDEYDDIYPIEKFNEGLEDAPTVSEYYYGTSNIDGSSTATPDAATPVTADVIPNNAIEARQFYNADPTSLQSLATDRSPGPPHNFGLHVLYEDFRRSSVLYSQYLGRGNEPYLYENTNIYRYMEADALNMQPFEYRISDSFRHKFTNYLNQVVNDSGRTLVAVDIESIGDGNHLVDFIEVGHIVEENNNGQIRLIKNYDTFAILRDTDSEANEINIVGHLSTHDGTSTVRALNQSLFDEGLYLIEPVGNLNSDYIHPAGRIGEQMGVVNTHSEAPNNGLSSNTDTIFIRDNTLEGVESVTQANAKTKSTARDITPQPFYSQRNLNISSITNTDIQTTLDELIDLFDNNITGAWSTDIVVSFPSENTYGQMTRKNIGTLVKRSGQTPTITMYDSLPEKIDPIRIENGRIVIPETNAYISMNSLNILAPDKDFFNGKLQSVLDKTTHIEFSQVMASSLNNENLPRYNIAEGTVVDLVDDDNVPRIRSSYSLGADMGDGGTDFVGIPFDENRPPVGSQPDTMTLRKIARSFAKTKTGKTLGLAWKTIDIGETLISKAFAQAQKAALAAGATTLGGAAAFAASAWALYEISNLIVAAGQQIPELKEVFERRNEILANGEEWEKQIVEETFWQDYGPELLEALQIAGERSPSEILSEKIWSFTLDNLRRQADGEVFEEALVDSSEELDTKDNIYYSNMTDDYKLDQMQKEIDYDKVYVGYLNNRPDANAIANRTFELANNVYNRER